MSKIINKPYLIFWIAVPVIILVGLMSRNEMLNINVQDIYFVFSTIDLAIVVSIIFAIIRTWVLGYVIFKQKTFQVAEPDSHFAYFWRNFANLDLSTTLPDIGFPS